MKCMNWTRMDWIIGACLSLLLIGGLAVNVDAQQPAAPPAPAETKQAPDGSATPPAPQPAPPSEYGSQPPQAPSTNKQIETRPETERVVEREYGKFLGVDPTVAMIVGAVLVIVIVIGLVAMGRRSDEVRHTDSRRQV
ncbi:MAG: hypothetical protein ACREKJ_06760 [Candidatus Rokuibacteriota bacterium]